MDLLHQINLNLDNLSIVLTKHLNIDKRLINLKQQVNGIIMIISCQKHKNDRLKKYKLSQESYNGWKVIYVIGDLFMKTNYNLINDFLYIKCEDSYLHLFKKVILSIEYLNNIFDIKEGILRCGDDLIFNDNVLKSFLISKKFDYMGDHITYDNRKSVMTDYFMYNYYKTHLNDFKNENHGLCNLTIEDIKRFSNRHANSYATGTIIYLSNKSCNILTNHFKNINYNILKSDTKNCYSYIIEDCAIGYILNRLNNIQIFKYNFGIKHTNYMK